MAKFPPYTKCFPPKTKQEVEQESSLYNNYDSLISTLPRSSNSLVQLSLFNGFWFPNSAGLGLKILHQTLAARNHFHPLPGDILLSSLPKVGTTWLKALAFAVLHRSDENLSSLLLFLNPHQCVPTLEYQIYANNHIPDLDALPWSCLLATHIPYSLLPPPVLRSESCCKIIPLSNCWSRAALVGATTTSRARGLHETRLKTRLVMGGDHPMTRFRMRPRARAFAWGPPHEIFLDAVLMRFLTL